VFLLCGHEKLNLGAVAIKSFPSYPQMRSRF
jgi:hypothetical protein